jgi:uncharacterized Zn finger protein
MAYLKEIEIKCRCGKRATVELMNRFNASYGHYCAKCGKVALKALEGYEQGVVK